ncbi:MAG: GspE/PulE family protein [Candidatus Goldiibacteriota bacterium]
MNRPKNMLIGEMLLEEGIISKEQLKDGLEEQKKTGEKIGEILINLGYITKEILWTFLGYQMGVPFINIDEIPEIPQPVLNLLPEQLMRNEKLIPVNKQGRVITVAMSDPLNFLVVDDLKATTRAEIDARLAPAEDIKQLLDKYFGFKEEETGAVAKAKVDELDDILAAPMSNSGSEREGGLKIQRSVYGEETRPPQPQQKPQPQQQPQQQPLQQQPLQQQQLQQQQPQQQQPPQQQPAAEPQSAAARAVVSQDTPVNTFLTDLLSDGYDASATDIHIEPLSEKCRIRRRIDGVLYEVESPPRTLYNGLLNKIKELAQMNLNEKTVPQESKLKIRVAGKEINMAVHTFPTVFGEKIILKIIRSDSAVLSLSELGMEEDTIDVYRKFIRKPHGLILLSGPTNSGKDTTLYSTLNEINDPSINVFSVDDTSSNYIIEGINQTKVNRKNFGQVVKMLAEQDCDVVTIGDVPGVETAEAVFDIIASGHLVIGKIRANDSFSALQTVVNYGIESYIVYSNTLAVLTQRLMRKICASCRQPYEAPPDIVKMLGGSAAQVTLYKGEGCSACSGTGYKGRTAIFEMFIMTEKIKDMLLSKEPVQNIREENSKNGLKNIKEAALFKLIEGTTTLEEYMKVN